MYWINSSGREEFEQSTKHNVKRCKRLDRLDFFASCLPTADRLCVFARRKIRLYWFDPPLRIVNVYLCHFSAAADSPTAVSKPAAMHSWIRSSGSVHRGG